MSSLTVLRDAVQEAYGLPCDDFDPECAGCRAWKALFVTREQFERLRAENARLENALVMDWQPIETAPRTGQEIIVGRRSIRLGSRSSVAGSVSVAWWTGEFWEVHVPKSIRDILGEFSQFVDPTHWMPYPEPPEQDKNEP